jgi:hypothetical protein
LGKTPVTVSQLQCSWKSPSLAVAALNENQTQKEVSTAYLRLRIADIRETLYGVTYNEKWRGNTIVDINPPGKLIPMFQRPQLESEAVPQ